MNKYFLSLLFIIPLYAADYLTVAYGPMCAGKSAFLLRQIAKYRQLGIPFVAFTHIHATNKMGKIVSRDTSLQPYMAIALSSAQEFYETARHCARIEPKSVLLLDEAQFFDKHEFPNLVTACHWISMDCPQVDIIAAGLDTDFAGNDFNCMGELKRKARRTIPLSADCKICGIPAEMTQRLVNGLPAKKSDPLIVPEGSDMKVVYEPRCLLHWKKPE